MRIRDEKEANRLTLHYLSTTATGRCYWQIMDKDRMIYIVDLLLSKVKNVDYIDKLNQVKKELV